MPFVYILLHSVEEDDVDDETLPLRGATLFGHKDGFQQIYRDKLCTNTAQHLLQCHSTTVLYLTTQQLTLGTLGDSIIRKGKFQLA